MSKKSYTVPHFVDILEEIQQKTGIHTDDARTAIESYIAILMGHLYAGEPVSIKGFGVFSVATRKGGTFRNPCNGGHVQKDDALRVRFRASVGLKRLING